MSRCGSIQCAMQHYSPSLDRNTLSPKRPFVPGPKEEMPVMAMEEGLLFVSKMVNGTRLELSASVLDVADKEYQEFTPECRLFNRGWSRQY